MAGMTCTITEILYQTVKKITFDYLTDNAAGTAAGTTTNMITGCLQRAVFDYGDADNLYDVVINDADGTDILHANGANLAQADVVKSYTDGLGAVVNSTLTLALTNGGNAKTGKVHLYFTG